MREVVQMYRLRLVQMEQEVVELFATNQLQAISTCIMEKQRIEQRVQKLEVFIEHWEPLADMKID
ncbi:hypothetical protein ACQCN2_07250 [Brevibacillus ginsengisoli]|uniref:hypothetical protein n=1 Tax=Brevibacillus ginsengisoli TaxID=363854 RepID=UPI003CF42813